MIATIPLTRDQFTAAPRVIARIGGLTATARRYPTGIEALTIANARGHVEVLPFMGQMLWDAAFDGLRLTMDSQFDAPRPAATIIGTYGCLGFHSGLLANGVPTAADSHPVHGEFPTCAMDEAWLELGQADGRAFVRLGGRRDHVEGFGPHYRATPSVTLADGQAALDWTMSVQNRSAFAMPLQYMAHLNPAWLDGATIHQPAPWTPERTQVRAAVPAHVAPNPDYLALIGRLADDPARMRVLDMADLDPEQVFYIRRPASDAEGRVSVMLRRPQGDGIAVSYRADHFPHLVRWLLANGDTRVAAFALPSTCEPEGRAAETAKGNIRHLAPGARADFALRVGYLTPAEAATLARAIDNAGAGA
ncbi:DUF4432 family protein [Paracoccus contaminans]|uniref:DUF4432 domain-containing protein n=1 Tax=Paracoccus contaminans TaxID=1945662 RepID=A0A1W6D1K3_9RHOB|nr:DUF4432 family protein [Paracoccus contaminans]ARJ70992.1 DUF4432 domain-containing protein [Paracoccus contaminans]